MHIVKYNKVKVLSGDVVLAGSNYDGYALYARVYHDVFVPDNKRIALYCCEESIDSDTVASTLKAGIKVDTVDIGSEEVEVTAIAVDINAESIVKFVYGSDPFELRVTGTGTTLKVGTKVPSGNKLYAAGLSAAGIVLATGVLVEGHE